MRCNNRGRLDTETRENPHSMHCGIKALCHAPLAPCLTNEISAHSDPPYFFERRRFRGLVVVAG